LGAATPDLVGCGGGHRRQPIHHRQHPPPYGNYSRVLKLPAGSNTQVELPFTGLQAPDGVAVDTAGNVYVTDGQSGDISRVLKLPAG
jgi:sugar lactone lactonase YvrE